VTMQRDRLFLLPNEFSDEGLGGRQFYCRECMTLNGLLAAFPERAERLDVTWVGFSRPRAEVAAAVGAENQALPLLVLADDAPDDLATGKHGHARFINELPPLLHALHVRHGFPEAHP
jgi:hypothetical protein